jgi:23S rRNA pseudouridine2604 synthase
MTTIKLKKSDSPRHAHPKATKRTPLRGAGSVAYARPTLAQAQAKRAGPERAPQPEMRPQQAPRWESSSTEDAPPQRRHTDVVHNAADAVDAPVRENRAFNAVARASAWPRAIPEPHSQRAQPWSAQLREAAPAYVQRRELEAPRYEPRYEARHEQRQDVPRREFEAPRHEQRHEQRHEPRHGGEWRQEPSPHSRSAPYPLPQRPSPQRPSPYPPARARQVDQHAARHGPPQHGMQRRPRDDDDDDDDVRTEHAPGSVRLSKRMSELGMASRREADEWIAQGLVRVDDHIVKLLGSRVMPNQRITIEAKAKHQQAQRVTVLINKPVGYVSGQAEDGYEPAFVLVNPQNQWREDRSGTRFLPAHLRNLVPAGRLDIDSVGLLVLTQDGRVARELIGEDTLVEKEYLVRVATANNQPLPESSLNLLRHGLEIDGEALRPAQVEWINDDQLRFVLNQGKKRQIRRMCEAVGLQVLGLKRVRIGGVMLGDLPTGCWRYLRADEAFSVKEAKVIAQTGE